MATVDPFDPGAQPSGGTAAPGRLGLVQAFVNSFWRLDAGGADAWCDLAGFRAWLGARGFDGADEADRTRALELREALRALGRRHHAGEGEGASELAVLDALGVRGALHLRFGPDGPPRHVPAGQGSDALLALVLGTVAEAMAEGTWSRMKACPGPHCGWLFYDASRNRSRQWCSMQLCGNRVKGREFRARRRAEAGGETDALRTRT
jgi:predicted RNA-binding Zn ribbon-like protein